MKSSDELQPLFSFLLIYSVWRTGTGRCACPGSCPATPAISAAAGSWTTIRFSPAVVIWHGKRLLSFLCCGWELCVNVGKIEQRWKMRIKSMPNTDQDRIRFKNSTFLFTTLLNLQYFELFFSGSTGQICCITSTSTVHYTRVDFSAFCGTLKLVSKWQPLPVTLVTSCPSPFLRIRKPSCLVPATPRPRWAICLTTFFLNILTC